MQQNLDCCIQRPPVDPQSKPINLGFMEGNLGFDGVKSRCSYKMHLNSVSGIKLLQKTLKESQSPLAEMVFIDCCIRRPPKNLQMVGWALWTEILGGRSLWKELLMRMVSKVGVTLNGTLIQYLALGLLHSKTTRELSKQANHPWRGWSLLKEILAQAMTKMDVTLNCT